MKKLLLFSAFMFFVSLIGNSQTTVNIPVSKDNTLYEDTAGSLSNGVGSHIFAGRTQSAGVRRALIHFDFSSLPSGAVIDTVVLTLTVNRVNGTAGADSLRLHRLNADWGEGTSNAPGQEGSGTTATTGDATWIHTFFSTSTWTNAGGDFNSVASSTISTSGLGAIFFGGNQMIADVNNWIANPNQNFGWIVVGDEGPGISARRFGSKDGATGGASLRVTYTITGITEARMAKTIEIYPIPTEDFLVIEHRRNVFTNEVRVFDTNGRLVIDKGLHMDNRLDVSDLKSGIYFLELRTVDGNDAVTKKFVKK